MSSLGLLPDLTPK